MIPLFILTSTLYPNISFMSTSHFRAIPKNYFIESSIHQYLVLFVSIANDVFLLLCWKLLNCMKVLKPKQLDRTGNKKGDSILVLTHTTLLNANVLPGQYVQYHFEKYSHIRANFYAKKFAQRIGIVKLILTASFLNWHH